jgi:hypothetical protein
MKFTAENRRITYSDNSEMALNSAQKIVFNNWEEGFNAYAAGIPITGNPHENHWAHKVRRVWREGWQAGAAVDRIAAEMISPRKYGAPQTKPENKCHTQPAN